MTIEELKKIREEMSLENCMKSTEELIAQSKKSKEDWIKAREERMRKKNNKDTNSSNPSN